MTHLVDAHVLSEPTRPVPNLRVVESLQFHERNIAVDPIILGEIHFGILLLPGGKRRTRLESWFTSGIQKIHCLPWEPETGLQWAALLARLRNSGKSMPIKDSLIAATALFYRLTVVTRNRIDFQKAGVKVVDPFSAG